MEIFLECSLVIMAFATGWLVMMQARLKERYRAETRQVLVELEKTLIRDNEELSQQVEIARRQRDELFRQKAEQFERIDGIVKEANGWRSHYHEQSIAHGNAQALMLETIERQAKALTALGRLTEVPPIIRTVMADFRKEHVMPAEAFLAPRPDTPGADLAGADTRRVTSGTAATAK